MFVVVVHVFVVVVHVFVIVVHVFVIVVHVLLFQDQVNSLINASSSSISLFCSIQLQVKSHKKLSSSDVFNTSSLIFTIS